MTVLGRCLEKLRSRALLERGIKSDLIKTFEKINRIFLIIKHIF